MSDTQTAAFETTFRDLTGRYLDSVLACSACLPVALECYETDNGAFQRELQRVSGHESDCDDLLGEIRTTVGDSMQPNFTGVYFQPGNVLKLFGHIDEVANSVEQCCMELAAMHPTLTAEELADLVHMADLVVEGTERLTEATADLVTALCVADGGADIQSQVSTIAQLESACDATRDRLLSEVFAGTTTAESLVIREFVVTLDTAMDAVEDAADHLVYIDSTMVQPSAPPTGRDT